jgi:hypothetical protein
MDGSDINGASSCVVVELGDKVGVGTGVLASPVVGRLSGDIVWVGSVTIGSCSSTVVGAGLQALMSKVLIMKRERYFKDFILILLNKIKIILIM